eukprot:CAMPEP_0204576648 /NCGR_PEP_ID=MMETSP0661-20131031/41893_1 /ASSEMBLY_ACC=CAM_ASM_000606 /TAXON_ID=109239 /ORGANISM="Alexandrium margalefi, Strain AMGDE01CS-322" /LENGTH=162 /DNA_ID=CAMNT_0051585415 /DNA_START=39 /DNA_END=525 /DNA_ORIENTATION=-
MSADTTTERHVVIAVDSSAESHNALEWALRNFNPTDLTFHVVHAYDPVTIIPLSPGGYVIPQDVIDQVNQQERDNAKEVAIPYERRLREAGVKHETEIIRGNVREALVRKAELVKAEALWWARVAGAPLHALCSDRFPTTACTTAPPPSSLCVPTPKNDRRL